MKTYTDEEISGLIEELRAELPALLKSELADAEPLAKMEAAKEGGNGTKPVVAGGMKKEEPVMKEASDESSKPPAKDDSPSPSASASPPSDGPPADAPPSDGPPMDGPSDAPPADPAAAGDGMGGGDQGQSLEQAYSQLAPEDLRAHYEAIKMVIMQQMQQGAGGDMGQAPMDAPPPAGPPAGPPMGKQMAPMAPPAAPQMGMGGAPMMRSEVKAKEEDLAKAEKVVELEKQVQGLTKLLETMLTKPVQKSITSMAEYMAKSELDKPQQVQLSRDEVKAKLAKAARKPDLAKSDRDLINRFVLQGDVNVKDIEHLLK